SDSQFPCITRYCLMPTSSLKINQRIEAVCEAGCEAVRASIETLESGNSVALTSDLSPEETQQVLLELKTIMSVYDSQ
ncbi:MAG: hypothetical protein OEW99_04550, partial [Gammaproteobacteria bacterium]|nr:hypothetical protein [Gammaproteobacteria bacterium]